MLINAVLVVTSQPHSNHDCGVALSGPEVADSTCTFAPSSQSSSAHYHNQVSSIRRYLRHHHTRPYLLITYNQQVYYTLLPRLELHQQAIKIQRLRQALELAPSNSSFRPLRFRNSSSASMPTPLTREVFISDDYVKVAVAQSTMFKATADGGVEEVPIPASLRETGIIPDGYSVGQSYNRLHSASLAKAPF